MTLQELQQLRQPILDIAQRYGAFNVRIFGSVVHGESDNNSDIDFLVDMEKGRSLMDMGGLLIDLQNILNCSVDLVTEKGLKKRISRKVLNDAVLL